MTSRPLRLGIGLMGQGPVAEIVEQGRRAEGIGFDVVLLADHLGYTAPLVPLVAIAEAAPTVQVGNLVLNAAFYRPALLARDLASVDSATGGRLIVGLGTGYVESEFEQVGLPFPTASARVKVLTEHVGEIRRLLSDPGHVPPPVQSPPPILVAGVGDKVLAMAAQQADIVAIASMGSEAELAERVEYVRRQAGDRVDDVELAFSFFQVSIDDPTELSLLRQLAPDATESQLRQSITLLDKSVSDAAERIQRYREEMGISFFTFTYTPGVSWDTLERLVAAVK
jgi:probable F420-dependent oxidoreductase